VEIHFILCVYHLIGLSIAVSYALSVHRLWDISYFSVLHAEVYITTFSRIIIGL